LCFKIFHDCDQRFHENNTELIYRSFHFPLSKRDFECQMISELNFKEGSQLIPVLRFWRMWLSEKPSGNSGWNSLRNWLKADYGHFLFCSNISSQHSHQNIHEGLFINIGRLDKRPPLCNK
jgi:hypothetical protein